MESVEAKYRVTLESVGFSGHRLETKEMTAAVFYGQSQRRTRP